MIDKSKLIPTKTSFALPSLNTSKTFCLTHRIREILYSPKKIYNDPPGRCCSALPQETGRNQKD
jgi:hypothetical protein